MARKNRPTLKQQFSDFINRIAPFDGNALIQKTEHLTVEDDLFDSLLNNSDSSDLINSPSAAISLDFAAFDMYRINSSASGGASFNITINNLGTGQVARIHITKKNNDTYSFTNAVIGQINNLDQTGKTILVFWVHNINGVLVAYADLTIAKSDAINEDNSNQLATSKAIKLLNDAKLNKSRFDIESGTIALIVKLVDLGDWNMLTTPQIPVAHGITGAIGKIKSVSALIRNDDDSLNTQFLSDGEIRWDGTNITLIRGSLFANVFHDDTPFNRGEATILYAQ